MRHSILIVDDDVDILKVLKANLELQGFDVYTSEDWRDARKKLSETQIDLLLLDLTLPDKDGLQICKEIRQTGMMLPIIMLTARDKLSDKIIGLESGADDYVVKPFETLELIARINACLRRIKTRGTANILKHKDIEIDLAKRQVKIANKEITLTPKEFNLLCFLLNKKGEVTSREDIRKFLYKESSIYSWSRVIDVHIQHLRHKLSPDEPERYIKTVPSVGYMIVE
ncbi:MAG: response regulator transcription factor [Thermodesulfovibrionales bacterium]|nr:response regulator transcription factor [Thermodesulfovibrionales bacterium]